MDTCYIISYDMAKGGNYDKLYDAIESYGTWAQITESTWAVETKDSAKKIRDDLGQYLPEDSRLFVVKSGTESAWFDVLCRNQWLKEHL